MKITTWRSIDPPKRDIIRAAVKFSAAEFFHWRTSRLIDHIRITKMGKKAAQYCYGLTSPIDYDLFRPKSYLIELNTELEGELLAKIVIHEMTHVKQFATGKLRTRYKNGKAHWFYQNEFFDDSLDADLLPWETEAMENESRYIQKFLDSHKSLNFNDTQVIDS